ncbi:hypothetical protein FRC00_012042, partial [Tulasnella sp. 408]
MTIKGFATFFTSRGKKEKDASLLSASANNNNNAKVPAIKIAPSVVGVAQEARVVRRALDPPSPPFPLVLLVSLASSAAPPPASSVHVFHHFFHHVPPRTFTLVLPLRFGCIQILRHLKLDARVFGRFHPRYGDVYAAPLLRDVLHALNENGKARHEALPRAPTPSQLDPHPQPSSTRLVVPQTSLAPTSTLLAPASSHPEPSSRGVNDGAPSHHPTANITSNNFDGYDPFAAHYTPPSSSTTTTSSTRKRLSPPSVPALTTSGFASVGGTAPESLSPLQLAPKIGLSSSSPGGTVGKQQQQLLSVQTKSAGRPRALSLGSTAHHHAQPPACPAHVLGPLPPLPPFAQGLVTKGTVLAAAGAVIQRIDCRNEEPPNSAPAHAVTFSGRDRSGSVASGGTTKSAGCN